MPSASVKLFLGHTTSMAPANRHVKRASSSARSARSSARVTVSADSRPSRIAAVIASACSGLMPASVRLRAVASVSSIGEALPSRRRVLRRASMSRVDPCPVVRIIAHPMSRFHTPHPLPGLVPLRVVCGRGEIFGDACRRDLLGVLRAPGSGAVNVLVRSASRTAAVERTSGSTPRPVGAAPGSGPPGGLGASRARRVGRFSPPEHPSRPRRSPTGPGARRSPSTSSSVRLAHPGLAASVHVPGTGAPHPFRPNGSVPFGVGWYPRWAASRAGARAYPFARAVLPALRPPPTHASTGAGAASGGPAPAGPGRS